MSRRSRQLTYWQPPQASPGPEPEPRDDVLWGWTVTEIHELARIAAMANRWLVSDFMIRFEAAWDGIVDELLAAESRPSRHDLQAAGKGAVSHGLLADYAHTYGVHGREVAKGAGSAPRFAAYWFDRGDEPFEERVTDRLALGQVMDAIGPRHARFLEALAVAPDTRSAAEALGILRSSYTRYVMDARRAFEVLWYSPEAPPGRKKRPNRYAPSEYNESRLAACGTPGAFRRHKRRGEEIDEDCAAAGSEHGRARKRAARERRAAESGAA